MFTKTFRHNGKWAKLTHKENGSWVIAYGWENCLKATRMLKGASRTYAVISANNYLLD